MYMDDVGGSTGCTAITFTTGTNVCFLWDKAVGTEGADESNTTCYLRKVLGNMTAVGDAWKKYWK